MIQVYQAVEGHLRTPTGGLLCGSPT